MLEDFRAIKIEIARRSGLQGRALIAYFLGVAWISQQIIINGKHSLILIIVPWILSLLTMNFNRREGIEIDRLGSIIKEEISNTIEEISGQDNCVLFPSEIQKYKKEKEQKTVTLNCIFKWSIYFIIPFCLTLYVIAVKADKGSRLSMSFSLTVIILLAMLVIRSEYLKRNGCRLCLLIEEFLISLNPFYK